MSAATGLAVATAIVAAVLCVLVIASAVILAQQVRQHADARGIERDSAALLSIMQNAETVRRRAHAAVAALPAYSPASLRAQADSTAFPIDAVFTWVDGTDERWRAALAAARRASASASTFHISQRDPFVPRRTRSNVRDELFYSAQLARAHLPWLRQIIIVTQRPHVPWWLSEETDAAKKAGAPPIRVVHHDEFFGADAKQPTFNSNVIESQFPRLAMLAEHFISFNDDTFVGQPLPRDAFFTHDGTPVIRIRERPTQCVLNRGSNTAWAQHVANFTAVCDALNVAGAMPAHQALPLRKSTLHAVTATLAPLLAQMQPLRDPFNFPVLYVAACATPWAAMPAAVRMALYRSGAAFAQRDALAPPHLFCINDDFDSADAHAALTRMLHQASQHR